MKQILKALKNKGFKVVVVEVRDDDVINLYSCNHKSIWIEIHPNGIYETSDTVNRVFNTFKTEEHLIDYINSLVYEEM